MSRLMKYIDDDQWEKLRNGLLSNCKLFIKDIKGVNKLLYRSSPRIIESYQIIRSHLMDRIPKDIDRQMHDELNDEFERRFGWAVRNGVFASSDYDDIKSYHKNTYIFFPIGNYECVWSPYVDDLYALRANGMLYTMEELEEIYYNVKNLRLEYIINNKVYGYDSVSYILGLDPPTKEGKYKFKVKRSFADLKLNSTISIVVKKQSFDEWLEKNYSGAYFPDTIVNNYYSGQVKEAILSGYEISFKCDRYYLINMNYKNLILDMLKNE